MGNDLSLSAEVTIVSAWNNHENTVFLPYKLKAVRHQLGYYICTFQEFIPVLRSDHSENKWKSVSFSIVQVKCLFSYKQSCHICKLYMFCVISLSFVFTTVHGRKLEILLIAYEDHLHFQHLRNSVTLHRENTGIWQHQLVASDSTCGRL